MAIEKQVVPLLAISFSDYEHGQFNPAYKIGINEEGSFSFSHINTKLLIKPKEIYIRKDVSDQLAGADPGRGQWSDAHLKPQIWGSKLSSSHRPPSNKLVKRRFMLCIHMNVCQFNVNFVC